MVKVKGTTLRELREKAGLSKRGLANTLAEGRLEGRNADVLRQYLSRAERREETEMSEEDAAAIADLLGVEVLDLEQRLVWAFHLPSGFPVDFGGRVLAWTDAGQAESEKTALGLRGLQGVAEWQLRPVDRAQLLDAFAKTLGEDRGFAEQALIVDPDPEVVNAHLILEVALRGSDEQEEWEHRAATLGPYLGLSTLVWMQGKRIEYMHHFVKPGKMTHDLADALHRLDVLVRVTQRALEPFARLGELSGPVEEARARARSDAGAKKPGEA